MYPSDPRTGPATRPIHRAIDALTSLKLDLQQLRRRLGHMPPEQAAVALAAVEQRLDQLGAQLIAIRDESAPTAEAGPVAVPAGHSPFGPDGATDDEDA